MPDTMTFPACYNPLLCVQYKVKILFEIKHIIYHFVFIVNKYIYIYIYVFWKYIFESTVKDIKTM
jgi:hypothetical protein